MPRDERSAERRSIRLAGYDYRLPAGYFVTICTYDRQPLFGVIRDGVMNLSPFGIVARDEWFRMPLHRTGLLLFEAEFVVLPNHVHGIVWLTDDRVLAANETSIESAQHPRLRAGSLGAIIGGYKAAVARRINQLRGTPGAPVWQRNYWDHIIRTEQELERIQEYIHDNPARWSADVLNPERDPRERGDRWPWQR